MMLRILLICWTLKVKIGHSVRTIKDIDKITVIVTTSLPLTLQIGSFIVIGIILMI